MEDKSVTTVVSPIATIKFSGGDNSDESSDAESIPSFEHQEIPDVYKEEKSKSMGSSNDKVSDDNNMSFEIMKEDLVQSSRVNPFDEDEDGEEEVFPQLKKSKDPEYSFNNWEHVSQIIKQNPGSSFEDNLQMFEDHFSLPEVTSQTQISLLDVSPIRETSQSLPYDHPVVFSSHVDAYKHSLIFYEDRALNAVKKEGLSTASVRDLEKAVERYKIMVQQSTEKSERHKDLVVKLINLRLKLAEAKDNSDAIEPDIKHVVGHRFVKKDTSGAKHYCEKCNTLIWTVLTQWYRCKACGFCVHDKCLNQITRTCPSLQVLENPHYILTISPEKGLATQNYRCFECRSAISYQAGFGEPRQCDYTGNYYCNLCHWNDAVPVPARILHNWDFEPRKVCRASKQFLKLMCKKPVLRVQDINPMLFSFVEELNQVKKLREEILIMKRYFLSCKEALQSKLLLQLRSRQHFVENSDMYSLSDLFDTAHDVLLPNLAKINTSFAQHIKTDCQTCQGKGYICELCDYQEILFPFDNHAVVCAKCSTVLHRHCFIRKNRICPKCERMNKRNSEDIMT